jgi:hypothetical protein
MDISVTNISTEILGEKGNYGVTIFILCGMTIFFLVLLTYFAQKVNVDVRYAAFIIIVIIVAVGLLIKYYYKLNWSMLLTMDGGNFWLSLGFLIILGIVFGILMGTAKDGSDTDVTRDSSFFSRTADYSVMNKYILSSVALWFAMLLTILLFSKIRSGGIIVEDSSADRILIIALIGCIMLGSFLNTTTEMNVYVVGDIVEVNDAGKSGWRWIRGKVREAVFNNFTQMTAVYVDNLEYGDQGDNEEGNKNSRFSYGLASVRKPANIYKIGDRVKVLAGDSWKNGTVNGFTYHHNGEINAVLVNRDDLTRDNDSYSILDTNVISIPPGE